MMTFMTLAQEWELMYVQTIVYDKTQIEVTPEMLFENSLFKMNHEDLVKQSKNFAQQMVKILHGEKWDKEDYRFDPKNYAPSGTEDRVPCRTFFVLSNTKQKTYKNYITIENGDFPAIAWWVYLFAKYERA